MNVCVHECVCVCARERDAYVYAQICECKCMWKSEDSLRRHCPLSFLRQDISGQEFANSAKLAVMGVMKVIVKEIVVPGMNKN